MLRDRTPYKFTIAKLYQKSIELKSHEQHRRETTNRQVDLSSAEIFRFPSQGEMRKAKKQE
jgi:hypothetical protein